ncbi:hypothetical protein [Anaerofustis stercorihominis]|uniref:LicD family protein n=1 Tax=Anaerofustis stercorihominis TaxID=214853 RepID=A0A3E3DYK6_9FIRM|nr:hypothetical protein [Anaerofustis stercorihominis]RGD74166.1 hypothetical protein DW687_05205 [Anaerofustis stercorihominis]
MTNSEIQLELIKEIFEICKKANINIFLYGNTAYSVFKNGKLADTNFVCLDVKDVKKFIKYFNKEKKDNRVIESMLNNGKYPLYELKYMNINTIDFNVNNFRNYKNNCLGIRIKIISHIPNNDKKKKYISNIYKAYKACNEIKTKKPNKKIKKEVNKLLKFKKLFSDTFVSRHIFKLMLKYYNNKSEKVIIGAKKFPSNLFYDKKEVYIDNYKFYIPNDYETFFKLIFGEFWEENKIPKYIETQKRFRDANHSWIEYKKRISDIDFETYFETKQKFEKIWKQYDKYNKKILRYYEFLDRTHDRFSLWCYYKDKKNKIKQLWENKDYDKLEHLLSNYIKALYKNYNRQLGLCFDIDIMEITMDFLILKGKENYVKELKTLIPEKHYKNIDIIDYKGKKIN